MLLLFLACALHADPPDPPTPSAQVAPPPPPVAARGDYCASKADCGWDHPCQPTRCGAPADASQAICAGPVPASTCTCVEGQCAWEWTGPPPPPGPACAADRDCGIEVATGRCAAGPDQTGPIQGQGPLCACEEGQCAWRWEAPVACESWKDCSWTREPRLRPISSTLVPRLVKHPVRACKDGEIDSVCLDGFCQILAWGC